MSLIGHIDDFPDPSATGRQVNGFELLVIRRSGQVFLYLNNCPHTRETLDPLGDNIASPDALLIHCQRHGAEFIADSGECVAGPCLGESLTPVAFTLSQGDIYLD